MAKSNVYFFAVQPKSYLYRARSHPGIGTIWMYQAKMVLDKMSDSSLREIELRKVAKQEISNNLVKNMQQIDKLSKKIDKINEINEIEEENENEISAFLESSNMNDSDDNDNDDDGGNEMNANKNKNKSKSSVLLEDFDLDAKTMDELDNEVSKAFDAPSIEIEISNDNSNSKNIENSENSKNGKQKSNKIDIDSEFSRNHPKRINKRINDIENRSNILLNRLETLKVSKQYILLNNDYYANKLKKGKSKNDRNNKNSNNNSSNENDNSKKKKRVLETNGNDNGDRDGGDSAAEEPPKKKRRRRKKRKNSSNTNTATNETRETNSVNMNQVNKNKNKEKEKDNFSNGVLGKEKNKKKHLSVNSGDNQDSDKLMIKNVKSKYENKLEMDFSGKDAMDILNEASLKIRHEFQSDSRVKITSFKRPNTNDNDSNTKLNSNSNSNSNSNQSNTKNNKKTKVKSKSKKKQSKKEQMAQETESYLVERKTTKKSKQSKINQRDKGSHASLKNWFNS